MISIVNIFLHVRDDLTIHLDLIIIGKILNEHKMVWEGFMQDPTNSTKNFQK
jgi:hypothetical protein